MRIILAAVAVVVCVGLARAELKYNHINNTWEYAPADAVLEYNYISKQYEYRAPQDSGTEVLKYNWGSEKIERVPERFQLQYNALSGRWEYAPPQSEPVYNFMEKTYQMYDGK